MSVLHFTNSLASNGQTQCRLIRPAKDDDPPSLSTSSVSSMSIDQTRSAFPTFLPKLPVDLPQKRQTVQSDGGSLEQTPSQGQPEDKPRNQESEAAINDGTPTRRSVQAETGPSSFIYSSQDSRLPSTSTPGSSPGVRPVVYQDEDISSQRMSVTEVSNPSAERDKICSSPTWDKDHSRKERRATKRLEAERKELEQRLIRLEEAQARLESGVYERNSRRLTKKQPLGSSVRSTSANTERPRSSSAFSAFFSGSRRSSRSRANSVDGKDADASRRCSTDTPPTLPLILPERFGTAVSRELTASHGTSLIPSHQLQRLHTTAKSDDLHEHWKVAEAWQRNHEGHEFDTGMPGQKPEFNAGGSAVAANITRKDDPRTRIQTTEPSADLDRELFTATLGHERKSLRTRPPTGSSYPQANTATQSMLPSSRNSTHLESSQSAPDAVSTRITTARQLHHLATPENIHGPHNTKGFPTSPSMPGNATYKHPKKTRVDASPQTHPKIYKPSPLALNPFTTDDFDREHDTTMQSASTTRHTGHASLPQTPRFPQSHQYEETRGRSRLPVSTNPSETTPNRPKETTRNEKLQSFNGSLQSLSVNSNRPSENVQQRTPSFDTRLQQMSGEAWWANVTPPLKHAGRSRPSENVQPQTNKESLKRSSITPDVPVIRTQEILDRSHRSPNEVSESKPTLRCLNPPARSRSSSQSSSHASYDTAVEEVLDISKAHRSNLQAQAPGSPDANSSLSTSDAAVASEQPVNGTDANNTPPPLARDGSISMLRRRAKQKTKPPLPDQLVAKVFVICCHCNYWHDMPSEVYAKLACPERIPSESLLVRTFSRRNSFSRKTSLRNSLLNSDPSEHRRLPLPKRTLPTHDSQATRETQAAAGIPLTPPSCCWCGHHMSRSCCQGWTTLVQMRERHH